MSDDRPKRADLYGIDPDYPMPPECEECEECELAAVREVAQKRAGR